MRDNAVVREAVIRRYTDKSGTDQYLLIRWISTPQSARLIGSLELWTAP